MARHDSNEETRHRCGFTIERSVTLGDRRTCRGSFHSTCSSLWRTKFMTITVQDTSKVTLALNVSCYSIHTTLIHGQTHLLDSMHPCLNVDEIVRLIACELVASRGKRTAVGLASCSRSFEDPVLDTLWETQDQLHPLLKSLPGDVWNDGGCTVSAPKTWDSFLSLTIRFESPLKDSRRRRNGPVSGSTLEGCKSSDNTNTSLKASHPRQFSRPCNYAPSMNPCSRN